MKLIDKDALLAEIERLVNNYDKVLDYDKAFDYEAALEDVRNFLDALEIIDPYEQCIQYASIESGIKAHAEDYSFNIESELFNQLTKEQQKLWRKEIEQACISGGYDGVELARDPRYKENLEVKEVDLETELDTWRHNHFHGRRDGGYNGEYLERSSQLDIAKHFFELGLNARNPITAADRGMAEEIIINLKRVEQDYCINLTREMEWLRNQVKKGK